MSGNPVRLHFLTKCGVEMSFKPNFSVFCSLFDLSFPEKFIKVTAVFEANLLLWILDEIIGITQSALSLLEAISIAVADRSGFSVWLFEPVDGSTLDSASGDRWREI
ncbi:MAG: hypothetical protein WBM02_10555 [bacterium]